MSTKPKSHHYVPVSYLKRFTDSAGWLYVRDSSRRKIRTEKPQNVMAINHYYHQTWASSGIDPNIFEVELGKNFEAAAKPVIDKLIMSPTTINDRGIASLLNYLELQRIRVPRQAKTAKILLREEALRSAPQDIVAEITAGRLQLTINDSARFEYMKLAVGSMSPWLARIEWEIFEAPSDTAFITTDSPVTFFNPTILPPAEAGLGYAGTKVLFPLSSRNLLLMRHPECRSQPSLIELPPAKLVDGSISVSRCIIWSREIVELTNQRMAYLSHELVDGQSQKLLPGLD